MILKSKAEILIRDTGILEVHGNVVLIDVSHRDLKLEKEKQGHLCLLVVVDRIFNGPEVGLSTMKDVSLLPVDVNVACLLRIMAILTGSR